MYSILDFGAVSGGEVLCTNALQSAVDVCAKNGGGAVLIPFGTYLCGTVVLCDNVHIVFEPGACILGSTDLKNHFKSREERKEPLYQDASHSYFDFSLFVARGCSNITFSGLGVIDMQSAWQDNSVGAYSANYWERRGAKIFAFAECKRVAVTDLTLRNATDLAVYLAGCENVRIHNLDIRCHVDGISPDGCCDVTVSNCIINTDDDALVFKSSYTLMKPVICENITVSGCVIQSRCNAIKFGTESNGGYKNIVVNGCTVKNTRLSGIALEIADGGTLDGVIISDITMKNVGNPLFVVLCDRRRGPEELGIGSVRNIIISNILANGPYEPWEVCVDERTGETEQVLPQPLTSSVTGIPGHSIENITLSNITLYVPGGEDAPATETVPENPKAYPENMMYGKLPCYGIFFRHCKGLKLINVNVVPIKSDKRKSMIFDDAHELLQI